MNTVDIALLILVITFLYVVYLEVTSIVNDFNEVKRICTDIEQKSIDNSTNI